VLVQLVGNKLVRRLEMTGNIDIERYFDSSDLSPPFEIGVILANFDKSGNLLISINVVNAMAKDVSIKIKSSFKN